MKVVHDIGEIVARPFQDPGHVRAGEGPQSQVCEDDDAEGSERAGFEPGQVVPGDVFHHFAAALDQASVARDERETEQVVPDAAEAEAEGTGARGRDDGAEGPARQAWW